MIDWSEAACQEEGVDPAWFFPPASNREPPPRAWVPARSVCSRCPLQQKCLTYAIEEGLFHGMFGGKTPQERRRIAALRGIPVCLNGHHLTPDNVYPSGGSDLCKTCKHAAQKRYRDKHKKLAS